MSQHLDAALFSLAAALSCCAWQYFFMGFRMSNKEKK